jgi:integrase/recombinase XerD
VGLGLDEIEPRTVSDFTEHLKDSLREKHNSVRRTLIGVRQFLRYLESQHIIKHSPGDLVPIPPRDESFVSLISEENFALLVQQIRSEVPTIKTSRDLAILLLLGREGIKASELIQLRWSDLLLHGLSGSLRVSGDRSRLIELEPDSSEALLTYRDKLSSHTNNGFIFVGFRGVDGSVMLPSLSRHGLKFAIYELGKKVQIQYLNTEQLRHRAIEHKLSSGIAIDSLMAHLGLRRVGNIRKHLASVQENRYDN